MMYKIFTVKVLMFCFLAVSSRELPSHIPICKRNQPDIKECMKKATVTLQPYLGKGVKELSIPPLEPLVIPMVKLEQGTGAINFKITMTKLNVFGLSNYRFRDLNIAFDETGTKMDGIIDIPKILLTSQYDIDGKVLLLPVSGNGDFNANITNCVVTFAYRGLETTKKGVKYLTTKETKVHLDIGDAQFHFGNLFNGDALLGQTTNQFFNQNSKEIVKETKPAIEAVVSMLIDDILNKALRSNPYDKLFPAN